ncbi:phosphatidylinositol 3-kinase C2 domain-containing subunit gamma isoform X2 [Moschus berezovskii]|uniref:phosphatidylinositol 3-kinase C2 domain-containing subunit gamma isoform X2 n=1 Tax=Moschus berezovskii TaxID=68408 RepID=UPI0024450615|nr:phosphatidylinositol 3-kinase C2 domain-containing subunit gamma isoform X2 [Moschus berezovskii]
MAYYWKTDLNSSESHEKQQEHQEFPSLNQPLSPRLVSLGFDNVVDEISNKIPVCQREIEENAFFVPSAPHWDSRKHSLDETHQTSLNEFSFKSSELSCHQVRDTPVIGFSRHSVLPNPQNINKGSSWGNPIGKYHGADDYGFNILPLSSTSLDKINSQSQVENENHNYHIGFESSVLPIYPFLSTNLMPKEEIKSSRNMNIVESSLMPFKGSSLRRTWESTCPKNTELTGCSIQLVDIAQGSNMSLASFCNKVKKIRETYHAADMDSNSGKIWSTTTSFPYKLFSNTKFNINIFTDNSTQGFHFIPYATYLVKDLIAEIPHFCTNDQLFPRDHLLSICGHEEFLQNDHYLGSHRVFQKNKSVIQLYLQKKRDIPGTLSRKHEDDHSQFYLNQLLEFMHIWKVSRQCLSTVIQKYDSHLKYLLKTQQNVDNVIEEVKNICSVLGCVETKQITDAVNELNLILQRKPKIDFPATEWEYMKLDSEENGSDLEEPPKECLKHIARLSQKQTPILLSEEKRRYLWFYRFYCNNENCSLPLVLGSAPGWDERTVSEMHTILRRWKFSHPLEALGLLTSSFPDQEIRSVAVQQLDNLLNDELLEYLPQLVQAVKFEWDLESPLVQLLLHRSLQSIQIAHRLYWLLKDAQNEAYFKSWYQKLLAALQFCAGKALRDEFSKEQKLIKILGDIGEKVKTASDPQRQEVLKKELGRLEEFFWCTKTCHLPLNPALCVQGIDGDACSYFTSNALPLKITFINANPMGKNISVIFKAGDDLRQDMLVLQIIQVMDNIWLQEGLDMQMIIYRCLSTGKGQGLVQMVPDAVTLAKIHRHFGPIGPLKENTIKKWFSQHNPLKVDYEKVLRNFFYSCAGWCVVTFILGVCDRHNDNIMLTKSGHMFHIDFGKFLGHAQTFGGIKRDRAPFIFTSEMEYFITEGGKNPQHFQDFVELCCRAYNIVRRHSRLLLNLLEMMLHAGLPELSGIQDLKYVYDNLRPQDTDLEATSHFTKKIKESLECFPVKLNNLIHTLAQMTAISPAKSTSQTFSQESCMPGASRSIQRATVLGFSKKTSHLYLIQVTHSNNETSLTEKSFDQFAKLHSQLQKQFASLTLPEFPHWWHLPFTNSDYKRFRDLNHYMEQILNGSYEVANSDCVLSFFLCEPVEQAVKESAVDRGEKFADKKPKVQLVISYKDTKLTILVKHMKNIHLPDGSAPSAHVEFYLLPHPSEAWRRKTKSVPKCTDPTYNEIVVYDEVTELQGHVLMLIVKSKTTFVGAINIQLCSVMLNEEKWYPLGNSII